MGYETVFDIRDVPCVGTGHATPLVMLAVGALLLWRIRGRAGDTPAWPHRIELGFLVFWMLGVVAIGGLPVAASVRACMRIKAAAQRGETSVAEGRVSRFVPMPYTGHSEELVEVDGKTFRYTDFSETACFHNTASHGGPLSNAATVRMTYVEPGDAVQPTCIVRLEIARGEHSLVPR